LIQTFAGLGIPRVTLSESRSLPVGITSNDDEITQIRERLAALEDDKARLQARLHELCAADSKNDIAPDPVADAQQTLPDWIRESNLKGDVQQQIKEVAPPRNQNILSKSNS